MAPASLKLLAGTVLEVLHMAALFRRHSVDLLHFNDTGCQPALLAAKLAGTPWVIGTLHSLPRYTPESMDPAHRYIEWVSMRSLDVAIAVSKFTKEAWVRRIRVNPNRIRVIYNGINVAAFRPCNPAEELRVETGVPPRCPVIGVTARLYPLKGHRYLLDAMPQVLSAVPRAHLVVTGDGVLRAALEQQARALRIADRVHFLGFRADVADVTQLYDVAVLPSVSLECLPYALMEAMALRKPVVASRFSGIPEVVDDGVTGTLVPRRDPKALAEAIIDLLKNPDKARAFGEAGRRRVEEKFTQERMLNETFALYDELVRCRNRRQRHGTYHRWRS
jgi:glycosyltransferase involved in cell wall biosynthesis